MKKTIIPLLCASLFALLLNACNKEVKEPAENTGVDEATLAQIRAKGFGTTGVQKVDGGYLVEGDILLSAEALAQTPTSPNLVIANEEQYHTFNLVDPGKYPTITVSVSGSVNSAFSEAVDAAITRYNAENLRIRFQRVASGGNINIRIVKTGQYIASAGFPTSGGAPHNEIKYASRYTTYSAGFMTTVLAHEIGHCIGFRHTDYMNRAYSCGSGGDEGQTTSGVGAVHIPGTPTTPDARSWMLACLGSNTDRPFNSNDKTALGYVY